MRYFGTARHRAPSRDKMLRWALEGEASQMSALLGISQKDSRALTFSEFWLA